MIKHLPMQAKIDMAHGVSPSVIAKIYAEYFTNETETYLDGLCKYYRQVYDKQQNAV